MKTVIEMAREADIEQVDQDVEEWICFTDELERFAELVRADEREACAKVCEKLAENEWADNERCAAVIRARSNT